MAKYFRIPWASGAPANRTTIPNTDPGGGLANYTDGYGDYYSQNPAVYPATAKVIERLIINENFYDVQAAIAELQIGLPPAWIDAAANDGITPYSYSKKAKVTYSGVVYESLIDSNTVTPGTDATKWAVVPFSGTPVIPTATASGSNTVTATFSCILPANATQRYAVIIANGATNTGAVTFNANGLGALSVVKGNNAALTGGEMPINAYSILQNDGGSFWKLLNPYPISATTAANGEVILASNTTMTSKSGNTVVTAGLLNRLPVGAVSTPAAQTYTGSALYTFAHGLSVEPDLVSIKMRVKAAQTDGGYTAGEVIFPGATVGSTGGFWGITYKVDATNVYVYVGTNGIVAVNSSGLTALTLSTSSKWEFVVKAWG